jgi:propionyl-CoA carboxylase alpha chain
MRIAWNEDEVREGFQASKNEAASSFGDDRMFIEKFVTQPRHIEIQVLADSHGNCVYLGERECSIQRRNQKVIEEAPSPFLDEATRKAMGEQACALAQAVGYTSAGTVEFIVDGAKNFYFLEMNTRLQVEHPVTELITGVDLVEQMIRVAAGEKLPFSQDDIKLTGWAMESRLYAEDPYRNFLPSIGRLTRYRPPMEVQPGRCDSGKWQGEAASGRRRAQRHRRLRGRRDLDVLRPDDRQALHLGADRDEALEAMRVALDSFEVEGIGHNLPFLSAVMDHPRFISGEITTAFIAEEYPEGFDGVTLPQTDVRRVAAAAAAMHRVAEIRRTRVTGPDGQPRAPRGQRLGRERAGRQYAVHIDADHDGSTVTFADGAAMRVTSDWTPGTASPADDRRRAAGAEDWQDPRRLPGPDAGGGPEGACPQPAACGA